MIGPALVLRNPGAAGLEDLPHLDIEELRDWILAEVGSGSRLSALLVLPPGRGGRRPGNLKLAAVLARDSTGELALMGAELGAAASYPALTPVCPQTHWFERELHEQWGVVPEGHPWLKPIRFEPVRRPGAGEPLRSEIGVTEFFRVHGDEVHEVAVGPVHAGVIEPGHFRFQCQGETVYHLEISLGYQHRGVERALEGGPDRRTLHLVETLAGDSTIGHATASCALLESLGRIPVSPHAETVRALALELERLANHVGDLGALAGDVGFLPTSSYCGRIRGDFLNMTALVSGNRFGRSLLSPGGTIFDVEPARAAEIRRRLEEAMRDAGMACDLLWKRPAILMRFEGTGVLGPERAAEIGMVGPAARASGLGTDVRSCHPAGWYARERQAASRVGSGDVYARARIRWLEVERSAEMIRGMLDELEGAAERPEPDPRVKAAALRLRRSAIGVALTEGFRGEICHVGVTDSRGALARYRVVDPSFHNWFGLAYAMRGQQISDFPLCNKSFNLSYSGHDL